MIRELLSILVFMQGSTVTVNLCGFDVAEQGSQLMMVGLRAPETVRIAMLTCVSTCWT